MSDAGSSLCADQRHLFDLVTVELAGEGWYRIVGKGQGGTRTRRVPADMLTRQAQAHLQMQHGLPYDHTPDPRQWSHAVTCAAVAFLMD